MNELPMGCELRTMFGRTIRLIERLGEGGQGVVYKVQCGSKQMAFKWYYPNSGKVDDQEKFIENLKRNVYAGAPSPDFVWPKDLVLDQYGSYGYIMDLLPPEYREVGDVLVKPSLVSSPKRLVDMCLNTAVALNILHDKGFSYKDVNYNNVAVEPQLGKVLIIDNDNVGSNGTDMGVRGYPSFMAPEIVQERDVPNVRSDLHSMAVLFFFLLVRQHPLVGRRGRRRDDEIDYQLFGSQPLFIFDPLDRSNAPALPDDNVWRIWPYLPAHVQDLFKNAFSQDALHNPSRRPSEMQWIRELVRFRSEIVTCDCGNEVFLHGMDSVRCEQCGRVIGAPLRIDLVGRNLRKPIAPVLNDARIYACQVMPTPQTGDALNPLVWMLASRKDPSVIGMRNMSQVRWEMEEGGRTWPVEPGQTVIPTNGMVIRIPGMRHETHLVVCNNTA